MRNVGGNVHNSRHAFERVEILRERLPLPVDAIGQRRSGDVFDTLHELDQPLVLVGSSRGETNTTITEHGRGHAVP